MSMKELSFYNGIGGFNEQSEYEIRLSGDVLPPAPWINVIANEDFGFLVSETGAGYTWAANSRENRLTAWRNDSIADPHGEMLLVRDEDDGTVWSALPGPLPADAGCMPPHAPSAVEGLCMRPSSRILLCPKLARSRRSNPAIPAASWLCVPV
jgi:cyclic beta-1,2-glucan synthetase